MRTFGLFMLGLIAGGTIAVQGVLNAGLGKRVGELGSVVIVAVTSAVLVLPLLALIPGAANPRNLPGPSQWYLYLGGVLGIVIVTTPIILVPRIGATATITALIV